MQGDYVVIEEWPGCLSQVELEEERMLVAAATMKGDDLDFEGVEGDLFHVIAVK